MRKIAIIAASLIGAFTASGAMGQQTGRSPSDAACATLSNIQVDAQKPKDFRDNRLALTKCELAITQGFRNGLKTGDKRVARLDKRIARITAQVQKMEN